MLTTYRRHLKNCEHSDEGRKYIRCKCPIWIDGTYRGERMLESLKTRNWTEALEKARDLQLDEHKASAQIAAEPITLVIATDEFIADAKARVLNDRTVYKYKFLFQQLRAFGELEGVRYLNQLDVRLLRKFRATWKDKNLAALKKLERLRSFYRFAVSNKWVEDNVAKEVKKPLIEDRQTLPYSADEVFRILAAAETRVAECQAPGRDNARRMTALLLLLRYSGLRIGDAVRCDTTRLADGRLRLYTAKTGTHVHLPLPEFVVRALDAIPKMSDRFWFWTGNGKFSTAVGDWQGRLLELAVPAKVPNLHAHRFRDTFAVELLLKGVPLERVSILLGHSSVKVTEKHYAPWIRERQEQAEADVRRTWVRDPVALMLEENALPVKNSDTPLIHGKRESAN
jgi:integrase/recombinase XerD